MKMQRSIEQWRNCKPVAMVHEQSNTALIFALEDAKTDILALHAALSRMILIAGASSDYLMGQNNEGFANEYGGIDALRNEMVELINQWQGVGK